MKTQAHMGRNLLLKRLTAQVGGDRDLARKILVKRGHMDAEGNLTEAGRARDRMTAAERAIDRSERRLNASEEELDYNPHTNYAGKRR